MPFYLLFPLCVLALLAQLLLLQGRLRRAFEVLLHALGLKPVVEPFDLRGFRALPRDRFSPAPRLLATLFLLLELPIASRAQLLPAHARGRAAPWSSAAA